jgi:hypothetical protein
VDHLLEEDQSRYAVYDAIRSSRYVQSIISQEDTDGDALLRIHWSILDEMVGLRKIHAEPSSVCIKRTARLHTDHESLDYSK